MAPKRKPRTAKPLPRDPVMRKIAGNPELVQQIADKLGVTYMAVRQWPRVPAERVLGVAKIIKVKPNKIRPDIYPA